MASATWHAPHTCALSTELACTGSREHHRLPGGKRPNTPSTGQKKRSTGSRAGLTNLQTKRHPLPQKCTNVTPCTTPCRNMIAAHLSSGAHTSKPVLLDCAHRLRAAWDGKKCKQNCMKPLASSSFNPRCAATGATQAVLSAQVPGFSSSTSLYKQTPPEL